MLTKVTDCNIQTDKSLDLPQIYKPLLPGFQHASRPLGMPAIDVGKTSGENASGTWSYSPENSQQGSDSAMGQLGPSLQVFWTSTATILNSLPAFSPKYLAGGLKFVHACEGGARFCGRGGRRGFPSLTVHACEGGVRFCGRGGAGGVASLPSPPLRGARKLRPAVATRRFRPERREDRGERIPPPPSGDGAVRSERGGGGGRKRAAGALWARARVGVAVGASGGRAGLVPGARLLPPAAALHPLRQRRRGAKGGREGARRSPAALAAPSLPPFLPRLSRPLVLSPQLSVFAFYAVREPQAQWVTLESGIWESPLTYRPDRRSQAWRFLSYMLVHAGIEHILGNLVLQLVLGIPLELVHKGHRVGLVYLAGVLGGSLASSVCDPLLGLVGASGGVYALIGGYFMNVLVNFREMIPLFGVARLLFIFIIVGTDVGFALYRRFLSDADGLKVSFVAHIAGGLAGMSVGYVIFSSFDRNFAKDPRFWACIGAYVLFVVFAVFFNVFLSPANQ
uniref:Rhomboid-related protein 2 n=1 Tax=Anolis carolinensis TaxID=28377 RepID=A0A803TVM9_ANOCA